VGRKSPLHRSLTVAVLDLALFRGDMALKEMALKRELTLVEYLKIL
jgi:hypothetical protein